MPSGTGDLVPPEKRCEAHSKQTGEPCGQFKVPGRNVCHYHGGKTPVGIAAPNLKHARYSKYLPQRLMEQYERSLNDETALVQREEIALAESRKADLLKRADTGESGALMADLRKLIKTYRKARTRLSRIPQDTEDKALIQKRREYGQEMGEALDSIFAQIENSDDDYRLWGEVQKVDNLLIRLRESERRHIQEQHEMYTVDEVRTMLVAVQDIIKKNVREQVVLQAVAQDLAALENISTSGTSSRANLN